MRRIITLLTVLAMLAIVPAANAATTAVIGQNDWTCGDSQASDGFTCDVERLQAAVDLGGKVRLEGTFNLGDPDPATAQTVFITKDVDLRGSGATIYGGYNSLTIGMAEHAWVFRAFEDWAFLPGARFPVDVTIQGIRFENFLNTAIFDVASTDLTVKDNVFVDAMPVEFRYPWEPEGVPSSYAVLVSASATFFEDGPVRGDISGDVTIVDNYVDGRARQEAGGYAYGGAQWKGLGRVFRVTTAAADVTIKGNEMRNFHELPITLDGVDGRTVVSGNLMVDSAASYDRGLQMFQIFEAGWALVFGGPSVDAANTSTVIRDNTVVSNHLVGSIFAVFDSDGVVIRDNEFLMTQGLAYDAFYLSGSANAEIKDNVLSGFGWDVLWLEYSSGNTFKDNDTAGFSASWVDYYADAASDNNTTYLNEDETYIDDGDNSWIVAD